MAKQKQPSINPLLAKNIPPPPVTEQKAITVEEQNSKTVERQSSIETEPEHEKATIEISLYLRPSQDDKLEELRRDYKRRTGKKISANEAMRRLIERAELNDLL